MEQPPTSPGFVGIDVSKDRLDVHVRPSSQSFAVARDGKGPEQLTNDLRALAPALIVLEATGGFEITGRPSGGRLMIIGNQCQASERSPHER